LIDGLALVSAIGSAQTFGDFAESFQAAVLQAGSRYQQIHVIFEQYQGDSIKSGTRERRTKFTRPILLLKMAVSLSLTVGQTSLHYQITSQI